MPIMGHLRAARAPPPSDAAQVLSECINMVLVDLLTSPNKR